MKKNIGSPDKIIRIVVGLGLIACVFVGPKTLWGLLGLIPLTTAFLNFCPMYSLLGVQTCPLKNKKDKES